MSNANISLITTANVFQDWLIQTNNLANSVNELRNGNYFKDQNGITIANGSLTISGTLGTLLSVSGNTTISQQLTVGSILDFGDHTVQGNNLIMTAVAGLLQAANGIQAKYIVANTGMGTQNLNAAGYIVFSGINLNPNVSPNVPFWGGLAMINIANKIFMSNTGNTYMNANVWIANANVQNLIAQSLLVLGELDAYDIILDPTRSYSIVNGNAVFNNLTVQGNTIIVGQTLNTTDTLQLRSNTASDGDGKILVYRGSGLNQNARLSFNHTSNVWQAGANDTNGLSTILTTANITDSFSSNSVINVASANAVNAVYAASISNATAVVANSGVFVAQRKGLNFSANSVLSLNVSANGANANLVDIVIQANVIDTYTSNSTTAVATANAVNAAYGAAITQAVGNAKAVFANNGAFVAQRQGLDIIAGNNITINVASNTANANLVDVKIDLSSNITLQGTVTAANNLIDKPTIKAQRQSYVNVGSVTGATTINLALGDFFDLTLVGNITLTFQNAATSGTTSTVQLMLRQTANGGNTVTFVNNVHWSDNITPVLTTTGNTMDVVQLFTYNNGTIYWGAQVLANIAGANNY
jgi:hypothetical protein